MYVFWYGVCIFYMCTKVINLVALQQLHPRCCFGKGCYQVWVSKCWRRSIRRERVYVSGEPRVHTFLLC